MKKLIGWALILLTGYAIVTNVWQTLENDRIRSAHPIKTFLSGGSNLVPAYNFWPPSTFFEIAVLIGLVLGLVLAFSSTNKSE